MGDGNRRVPLAPLAALAPLDPLDPLAPSKLQLLVSAQVALTAFVTGEATVQNENNLSKGRTNVAHCFDVLEYFLSPIPNLACIAPRRKAINVKSNISWKWQVVGSAITIVFVTILTLTILA